MHNGRRRSFAPLLTAALLISVAPALAACSGLAAFFGAGTTSDGADTAPGDRSAAAVDADALTLYLTTMHALAAGDPAVQTAIYDEVEDALNLAPTTTNRLRHALMLATPGHPGSNPSEARHLLTQLLAMGNTLMPGERMLATIHLQEVEQRLMLDAEAASLRAENAAALAARDTDAARQLTTALEENRRLRAELDDALERLEAIATIERSIRERENGPESP